VAVIGLQDLLNFFGENIQHQGLATCLARSGKRDNNAVLRNVNKSACEKRTYRMSPNRSKYILISMSYFLVVIIENSSLHFFFLFFSHHRYGYSSAMSYDRVVHGKALEIQNNAKTK
jgi:hypothetical protein